MARSVISGQEVDEDNPFAAVAAGVGFDNPFEADLLPPDKRQEQYVAETLQREEERATSENPNWTAADLINVARSYIDGLWMNKGEELGTFSAATGVKLRDGPLPPIGPVAMLYNLFEGDSVFDIQKEMLTSEEAKSANFGEQRPVASAVANIAGNITSPATLTSGALLSNAMNLRKGQQAIQAGASVLPRVTNTGNVIRGAGTTDELLKMGTMYGQQQAGTAASLLSRVPAPKAAPWLAPVGAASGVAAVEGGVIGFEGDTLEDKTKNAAITAGISATVPFFFAGAKKGFDIATESKMATQLGKGADFVNLMFTEHALAPVYRTVISKAYGGRGLSEQQARSVVARIPTPRAAKDAAIQIKESAKRKLASAKNLIGRNKDETLAQAKATLDEEILNIKNQTASAVGDEKTRLLNRLTELEEIKGDPNKIKFEAVRQADEAVNSANGAFRGQVLNQSVPAGTTADEIAGLGSLDPQDANALLDDLWKAKGFSFADGKQYGIDAEDAGLFIEKAAKNYPELSLVEGGSIVSRVQNYITQALEEAAPDGTIEGRALVNLRSQIGRAINGLSDDKTSTRRFSTEVQDYFHDILKSKLKPSELAAFEADKLAWSVRSLVDDATAKASGGDARSGAFTPKDFLDAIRSYSPRFAARGAGRLQKEAQELVGLTEENSKNILALAEKNARDIAKEAMRDRNLLRAQLEQTKTLLKKQQAKEIAEVNKRYAATKTGAQNSALRKTALEEAKSKHATQLLDLDNKIETTANEVKALAELMPGNFRGSVFENLFNTALVGQTIRAAGGGMGEASASIGSTLITGLAGSRILATESAQRFFAKQTGAQAGLRNFAGSVADSVGTVIPKGAGQIGTAAGVASVTAEGLDPTQPLFTKEKTELLMKLPVSGKAALYRNLKAKGSLDRLKAENPTLYKLLKQANDR